MALPLDQLESKLAEYERSTRHEVATTLFLYHPSYKDLCRRFGELNLRVEDSMLEAKHRGKVSQLLVEWHSAGRKPPIPPHPTPGKSQKTILSDVLVWTLNRRGFTIVSSSDSNDITHYELEEPSLPRRAHLRVLVIPGSHLIAYLDQFALKSVIGSIDYLDIPLRFDLACIQPLLTGGEPPALAHLPREVLVITLAYMRLEDMANASLVSASLKSAFESDELWMHVHACFSNYINGPKPPSHTTPVPGHYKTAISNILRDRQARREMSFAHSGTLDNWGGPLSHIDSGTFINPVRRRRLQIMDDIDLFI